MSGVSKSQVSRLCGELDERVGAFETCKWWAGVN
jgi:transposase-like protein